MKKAIRRFILIALTTMPILAISFAAEAALKIDPSAVAAKSDSSSSDGGGDKQSAGSESGGGINK